MVKTRLMNQTTSSIGSAGVVVYNGVIDCFRKIMKVEGIAGLYRGLPANLVGITPEKAIKLAGNDFFRSFFGKLYFKSEGVANKSTNPRQLPIFLEMLAGGCAGAVQVIATNPMVIRF